MVTEAINNVDTSFVQPGDSQKVLQAQTLPGVLPLQLVKLPYMHKIDFHRNYLSGPIPKEWGATKLVFVALRGNRLSGTIPFSIANISTLTELLISSNYFTGTLPESLAKLTNLEDLLISDNKFSEVEN